MVLEVVVNNMADKNVEVIVQSVDIPERTKRDIIKELAKLVGVPEYAKSFTITVFNNETLEVQCAYIPKDFLKAKKGE
jgi:tRNA(Ile)-lysidine synthase TilS/MesJ